VRCRLRSGSGLSRERVGYMWVGRVWTVQLATHLSNPMVRIIGVMWLHELSSCKH
jgi:hypothetical protein